MSEYNSPVPEPGATAPGIYREIYPMPMFVIVPTADLGASRDFWVGGLGFADLFSTPGQVTHLRRWAFQDVLLVPGDPAGTGPAMSVSFACVLDEVDGLVARCEALRKGCVAGPEVKPWNSVEITVTTPENTRVVMTAARPLDPEGEHADFIRSMGIEIPPEAGTPH